MKHIKIYYVNGTTESFTVDDYTITRSEYVFCTGWHKYLHIPMASVLKMEVE
ncbi:hypothetical protein FACS1894109_15580 [Spirochaetia bacterium]|nr:hypothetical protein FACS1894109_15580 [Spirochaetia bacterium]